RRQYFNETDETVLKRTQAALEYGITPIVCVGELLADRESGNTEAVLAGQFKNGIAGLTEQQFAKIVIAYEPVWAIGTGKTATPDSYPFATPPSTASSATTPSSTCRIGTRRSAKWRESSSPMAAATFPSPTATVSAMPFTAMSLTEAATSIAFAAMKSSSASS